jgi:HEAT repeat protein
MFEFGFDKEIAALRRKFEGGPLAGRRAAAEELVEICIVMENPAEALTLLESMLLDPDDEVSAAAKRGYMACHEAAVKPLTRLIEHPVAQVRERACDALGYLHEEVDKSPARSLLLAALADVSPRVRGRAVFALGPA